MVTLVEERFATTGHRQLYYDLWALHVATKKLHVHVQHVHVHVHVLKVSCLAGCITTSKQCCHIAPATELPASTCVFVSSIRLPSIPTGLFMLSRWWQFYTRVPSLARFGWRHYARVVLTAGLTARCFCFPSMIYLLFRLFDATVVSSVLIGWELIVTGRRTFVARHCVNVIVVVSVCWRRSLCAAEATGQAVTPRLRHDADAAGEKLCCHDLLHYNVACCYSGKVDCE